MTLERVRELMEIERECVKQANTCGRDCAKCDLVQEDKDLLKAYEIVQYALVVLEHFNDAMDDLEALAKNREKELYKLNEQKKQINALAEAGKLTDIGLMAAGKGMKLMNEQIDGLTNQR